MSEPPKPKPKRKKRTRRNRDARPYKRKSDGKYVAVAYLPNGKRRPVYGDSAEEAEDKRKKLYQEIENEQPITVGRTDTVEKYLMGPWLTATLPQRVLAGRLSQSTLDNYAVIVEKHIVPHLGRIRLVDLSTAHVRVWLLELSKKPSGQVRKKLRPGETELPPPKLLSARTQGLAHAVLRKALNDAVDDEILKRNVCLLVDPPVDDKEAVKPLTKLEAAELLAAASDHRLWCYWIVILALGLRRGEGLGMRWSNIDLDAGTVKLSKSIQRLRGEKDEETGRHRGQLVEKSMKTDASRATMLLPEFATEALRRHAREQKAERLAAKVWVDPDLVFATTIGTALEPRNVNRMWDEICDKAGGRRVRIHDLRHACGSFLFADGVDMRIIQGVLRHTRLATTADVYVHLLTEVQRGAADTMNTLLTDLTKKQADDRRRS